MALKKPDPKALAKTLMDPESPLVVDPSVIPGGTPDPNDTTYPFPMPGEGEGDLTTAQILAGVIPSSQWARGQAEPAAMFRGSPELANNTIDTERWAQFIGAPYGSTTGMYNGWNVQDAPSWAEYQQMIDRPGASSAPQMMGPGVNVQQNMAMAEAILEAGRREWEADLAKRDKAKENRKPKGDEKKA